RGIRRSPERLESRHALRQGRPDPVRRRSDRARGRLRRAVGRGARTRAGSRPFRRRPGREHRPAGGLRDRSPRVPRQSHATRRSASQAHGTALLCNGRRRSEVADGLQGPRRDRGCRAVMKSFLYELDKTTTVATITLNRPERLNALTFEVYKELRDKFRALDTEAGVRAIIITGAGRAFCSGGDVEDIIGALLGRDLKALHEFTRLTCDLILAMRRCRRPIIGALNGTVAGAGAVIAAACDIRIAAESAKIAFLFTKVGLSGADMGAAWLLPRLVGYGH